MTHLVVFRLYPLLGLRTSHPLVELLAEQKDAGEVWEMRGENLMKLKRNGHTLEIKHILRLSREHWGARLTLDKKLVASIWLYDDGSARVISERTHLSDNVSLEFRSFEDGKGTEQNLMERLFDVDEVLKKHGYTLQVVKRSEK